MKPLGLNEAGFVKHAKKTRKAPFLAEMNEVKLWSGRMALIDSDDPKAGNGRRPIWLERMRRIRGGRILRSLGLQRHLEGAAAGSAEFYSASF